MSGLGEYLREATAHHWAPGLHDCCTLPGDWAATWGLGDPMAEWRGTYRSDAQAIRVINRAGGLLALWERGLGTIGICTVDNAASGDVGVIAGVGVAGVVENVGAIYTGEKWAWFSAHGLMVAPAVAIRVWGWR